MFRIRPVTRVRLLVAILGLAAVLCGVLTPSPAEANPCGGMWITTFYDDYGATVGQEGQDCGCNYWSWGIKTNNSFTHWDYC